MNGCGLMKVSQASSSRDMVPAECPHNSKIPQISRTFRAVSRPQPPCFQRPDLQVVAYATLTR